MCKNVIKNIEGKKKNQVRVTLQGSDLFIAGTTDRCDLFKLDKVLEILHWQRPGTWISLIAFVYLVIHSMNVTSRTYQTDSPGPQVQEAPK